jgi:hypothetical protein
LRAGERELDKENGASGPLGVSIGDRLTRSIRESGRSET